MDDSLVRKLVELNTDFYVRFAAPFAASRSAPQPGFFSLLEDLPARPFSVLDVGCGNGRFGRFLHGAQRLDYYVGVDATQALLDQIVDFDGELHVRDISLPDSLKELGKFDLVVCLATLQHIPGQENRLRLLREMAAHLEPTGLLVLSNWQFLNDSRQRRKIRPWALVDIDPSQVEPNDYLLSWERGGSGIRYVAYLDEKAIEELTIAADLRIVKQFVRDGREGNLNLYTILAS